MQKKLECIVSVISFKISKNRVFKVKNLSKKEEKPQKVA